MKKTFLKITVLAVLLLIVAIGCKKDVFVTGVTLDKDNITLAVGATETLTATVLPHDATNKAVSWTSSNTVVVTVENGVVTAKEAGTATITVTTEDGNYTATCAVTVIPAEVGVVINGVRWSTRNVAAPGTFAANPEDAGMFYQWNRNVGWSSTDPMVNSNGGTTWDSSIPTSNSWEKANDPCPTGWRMPTLEEQQSLSAAGSEWTTENGVNGRIFGSGETAVFLPAAGGRDGSGALYGVGSKGRYWSGTPHPDTREHPFGMDFNEGHAGTFNYPRSLGISVRCISELIR